MIKYAIRRMIYVLPTLWAVVTFVFFLIRIVPGGPAVAALGSYATAESIRQLEKQMGLDKPILALLADGEAGALRDKTVLWWNSYNSRDFSSQIASADFRRLPKDFHHYFENGST